MLLKFKACHSLTKWGRSEEEFPSSIINMTIDLDVLGYMPDKVIVDDNIITLDWDKGLQETLGHSIDPLFRFTCKGKSLFEVSLYSTRNLGAGTKVEIYEKGELRENILGGIPLAIAVKKLASSENRSPFSYEYNSLGASINVFCEKEYEIIKQTMQEGCFREERKIHLSQVRFDEKADFCNDYIGYSFNTEIDHVDFEFKLVCMGDFQGRDSRYYIDGKTLEVVRPQTAYTPLFQVGIFTGELDKRTKRIATIHQLNYLKKGSRD
jgi:hypothetical protein